LLDNQQGKVRHLFTYFLINCCLFVTNYFILQMDNPITRGAYVTVLASNLGLYTVEIIIVHTRDALPRRVSQQTVITIRMACGIGGNSIGPHAWGGPYAGRRYWVSMRWSSMSRVFHPHGHPHHQDRNPGRLFDKSPQRASS
jgi:hypothetical protein